MFKTTKIVIAMIVAVLVAAMVGIIGIASYIASDKTVGMMFFFCFPIVLVAAALGEVFVRYLWSALIPHDYAMKQRAKQIQFAIVSRYLVVKSAAKKLIKASGMRSGHESLYERYLEVKSN